MRMRHHSITLAVPIFVVVACGGGKPAESPSPPPASSTTATKASSSAQPQPTPAAAGDADGSGRKPRDLLTDAEITFVLAFDESDPGKAAEQKCDTASKGDAKKRNECMAKARDKIQVEAMRFKQDEDHTWWWQSLRRKAGSYAIINKVPIEFGEETDHRIVLKPKGKGGLTKEVPIEVPNSFSIVIQDPQNGRMVYDAKIGLIGK